MSLQDRDCGILARPSSRVANGLYRDPQELGCRLARQGIKVCETSMQDFEVRVFRTLVLASSHFTN
ncbi:MAG: hypothetical protein ACKOAH_29660 [Pirellula sp.]